MIAKRRKRRNKGAGTHPLYSTYAQIIYRCFNEGCPSYKHYGGRGITMSKEWVESFDTFIKDVGERPSKSHTIDRFPNKDGNYENGNVRWATKAEQSRNTNNNNIIEFDGRKMCMTDWAHTLGIKYCTLFSRINIHKWPIEKALTTLKVTEPRNQYTKSK